MSCSSPLNRMPLKWTATETQDRTLWHSIFGHSDWMMGPKLHPARRSGDGGTTEKMPLALTTGRATDRLKMSTVRSLNFQVQDGFALSKLKSL